MDDTSNYLILLMNDSRQKMFWDEVIEIQKSHRFSFPPGQMKYIKIDDRADDVKLEFLPGYGLSNSITFEIKLIFSLIFSCSCD